MPKKKVFILLLFLILLSACATLKQPLTVLQERVDSLMTDKFFCSSQTAISVYDLTENKSVFSLNDKLLMHPASNLKILTTTAGYLFLGADYNFKTSVYHTGEIKDSICSGDIYVKGGFYSDFSISDLDSVVYAIKSSGIKSIRGNLYADVSAMDSLFWGEGWMWDDDPYSFASYLTPLCINKNSIQIIFEPGITGEPAKIKLIPDTKFFLVKNNSLTIDSGKSSLTATRDWLNRNNSILVSGKISRDEKTNSVSLNVFNPTLYFLTLMRESFIRKRISIEGKIDTMTIPVNAKNIFSLRRSIQPVIKNTNKLSDNLSAEMILRALALKKKLSRVSASDGKYFIDSLITLTGDNPKNYSVVDGSGMSSYNLLSSELILNVLKYIYYSYPKIFEMIYDSLPIAGNDGNLSGRMKNNSLTNNLRAKTGTMRGVSCLSGYLKSKKNHLIAFSIFTQHFAGPASKARELQDKLCEIIYESN